MSPHRSRPNLLIAATALALPALFAAGSASAGFQLRVPLGPGSACAGGACAGGGPLTLDVSEIPMYAVLPPDYEGQPDAYYDLSTIYDSQGEITVQGGTAPYTYSLRLKEHTSLYGVNAWATCAPTAWEGYPGSGTDGIALGIPGDAVASCSAVSVWDAPAMSLNYAAYSVETTSVTGNVTRGTLNFALYSGEYSAATGLSLLPRSGSGYIFRYQLTVTDSAGHFVTSPVKLYTIGGF